VCWEENERSGLFYRTVSMIYFEGLHKNSEEKSQNIRIQSLHLACGKSIGEVKIITMLN
jgi:hypothetical protein